MLRRRRFRRTAGDDHWIISGAFGIHPVIYVAISIICTDGTARKGASCLLAWSVDPSSAVGAGVVLIEPHLNAVEVEPVLARQHGYLSAQLYRVHAYGALCFTFGPQHLPVNLLPRQGMDRTLRSRRWRIAVLILVDQLRYYSIQLLLRIDSISVAIHVQKTREDREWVWSSHDSDATPSTRSSHPFSSEIRSEEFKDTDCSNKSNVPSGRGKERGDSTH